MQDKTFNTELSVQDRAKAVELHDTIREIFPKLTPQLHLRLDYLLDMINDEDNYGDWTLEQEKNMIKMIVMNQAELYAFSQQNPSTHKKWDGNDYHKHNLAVTNSVTMDDQGFEGHWLFADGKVIFKRWVDQDGPV